MKKAGVAVAVVAVVVVGVWGGAAWYTGKRVEDAVRETVDQANAGNDWGAKVEVQSYDRGWFSSTARYRVSGLGGALDNDTLMLVIDSTVRHGPFPLDRVRAGKFAPVLATTHSRLARDVGLGSQLSTVDAGATFEERSVIDYQRNVHFDVSTPALSLAQNGGALEIAGGSFTGESAADLSRMRVEGKLEALRISSPAAQQTSMELRNMSFAADNHKGRFGLQIGDGSAKIGSMSIAAATPAGPFSLVASNIAVTSKVAEEDRFLNVDVGYNIGKVGLNGVELGALDARFLVRNMDGAATAELTDRYRQLAREANLGGGTEMDEEAAEKMLAALEQPLNALMAGAPEFALDTLTWTAPAGQSSLKVVVKLRDRERDAEAPADGEPHPGIALDRASLDLVLSQPAMIDVLARITRSSPAGAKLSEEQSRQQAAIVVAMLLSGVADSGLLEANADKVESHVSYDGKVLNVNGEEMPPEALLQLLPIFPEE